MKKLAILTVIAAVAATVSVKAAEGKDAKANYTTLCKGCHGEDGKGQTALGKKMSVRDYTDAKVQATLKDEEMFKTIKEGLKKEDKVIMKPYSDKLSDDEIKALVAYMRAFKK
jgi:cytochrome c6